MLDIIQNPKFIIELEMPKTQIIVNTPTKRDYLRLIQGLDTAEDFIRKYGLYTELPPLTESVSEKFVSDVIQALKDYREINIDYLMIPEKTNFSGKKEDEIDFPILTHADNIVYQHSGLTFIQQLELSITEYWLLLADAVKIRLSDTEKGREYLHICYMDMDKISTIKPNI